MEHTLSGLIKKRGEIAGQHKVAPKAADALKADLDAIDRALVLCVSILPTFRGAGYDWYRKPMKMLVEILPKIGN